MTKKIKPVKLLCTCTILFSLVMLVSLITPIAKAESGNPIEKQYRKSLMSSGAKSFLPVTKTLKEEIISGETSTPDPKIVEFYKESLETLEDGAGILKELVDAYEKGNTEIDREDNGDIKITTKNFYDNGHIASISTQTIRDNKIVETTMLTLDQEGYLKQEVTESFDQEGHLIKRTTTTATKGTNSPYSYKIVIETNDPVYAFDVAGRPQSLGPGDTIEYEYHHEYAIDNRNIALLSVVPLIDNANNEPGYTPLDNTK